MITDLAVQAKSSFLYGSGAVLGATSVTLTDFTDIYGNALTMLKFGVKGFGTLEPGTDNEESITWSGITANLDGTYTLTGVKTALAVSPFTETSGLLRQHSGGVRFIVSNTSAFYNDLTAYVDSVVVGGAADSSTTTKGIAKLTTAPTSPTDPIAVGATDVATTGASKVVRSKSNSLIDDSLVALTTAGDVPYSDGTDITKLAIGAAGTYARSTGTAPSWGGANLDEANTFFNTTDITAAEAETLTNGSVTSIHVHEPTIGSLILVTAAEASRPWKRMASSPTNNDVVVVVTSGSSIAPKVYRFAKDATGTWYQSHVVTLGVTSKASFTASYPVIIGSFVYVTTDNGGGVVRRLALADLTGEAAMTFSGTAISNSAFSLPAFTDGTDLYVNASTAINTNANYYRYTISGTVLTNAATVGYGGYSTTGNNPAIFADATNVWFFSNGSGSSAVTYGTVKYTLAGSLVSTTAARVYGFGFHATSDSQGISGIAYSAGTGRYMAAQIKESSATDSLVLFPIAKP